MKSIALVILASSMVALVKADNDVVPAASHLRKGAAAVPVPEDRELSTRICYKVGADGVAKPASCATVGSCAADVCCGSPETCFGLGQFWCKISNGYAVDYVDQVLCPYKWSCCY